MNWFYTLVFFATASPVLCYAQLYEPLSPTEFDSYFLRVMVDSSAHGVVYQVGVNDGRSVTPPPPRLVIQRVEDGLPSYFLLAPFAKLKNDSTVIFYSSLFQHSLEHEVFEWPEGRWMHVTFPAPGTTSGVRYHPDSLPPGLPISLNLPSARGIYLYTNGELKSETGDQSEESFIMLQKTGYYFLPAPGTFYHEMDIRSIK